MQTDDTETVIACKSEILSDESIKSPTAPGSSLASKLKWIHSSEIAAEIKRSCLKKCSKFAYCLRIRNMIKKYRYKVYTM